MNEEKKETQVSWESGMLWEEAHPWLSRLTDMKDDEDASIDEVIRYTLDELRFA